MFFLVKENICEQYSWLLHICVSLLLTNFHEEGREIGLKAEIGYNNLV